MEQWAERLNEIMDDDYKRAVVEEIYRDNGENVDVVTAESDLENHIRVAAANSKYHKENGVVSEWMQVWLRELPYREIWVDWSERFFALTPRTPVIVIRMATTADEGEEGETNLLFRYTYNGDVIVTLEGYDLKTRYVTVREAIGATRIIWGPENNCTFKWDPKFETLYSNEIRNSSLYPIRMASIQPYENVPKIFLVLDKDGDNFVVRKEVDGCYKGLSVTSLTASYAVEMVRKFTDGFVGVVLNFAWDKKFMTLFWKIFDELQAYNF